MVATPYICLKNIHEEFIIYVDVLMYWNAALLDLFIHSYVDVLMYWFLHVSIYDAY